MLNFDKFVNEAVVFSNTFNFKELLSLTKFTQREQYCNKFLEKIASGTGRIVYIFDDKSVIKLAKNEKGIAQNRTEGDYNMKYSCITEVLDSSEDYEYLHVERARKCSLKEFKQLMNVDFKSWCAFIWNWNIERKTSNYKFSKREISNENNDYLNEHLQYRDSFVFNFFDMILCFSMASNEFMRISCYGIVNRDGEDCLVVTDYGLTEDVFDEFYNKKRR